MRSFTLVLFFCALAAPARAADEDVPVKFASQALKQNLDLPAGPRTSNVLWESGPSDPVPTSFEALLLEGIVSRPGISFEASLCQGSSCGPWITANGKRFDSGRFWAKIAIPGEEGAVVRLRAIDTSFKTGLAVQIEFFGLHISQMEVEKPDDSLKAPNQKQAMPPSSAPMPDVIPRVKWMALPATRPYEIMTPVRITVHHTDGRQAMSSQAAIDELRFIQNFHQNGRGWIDIGYHFLIDGSGQIWEGRPAVAVGAHVGNRNEGNIGISLMGDFQPPKSQRPTPAQIKSLVKLLCWLTLTYDIPTANILGHRDQKQTDCPGRNLYSLLNKIRDDIRKSQASPANATLRATDKAAARIYPLLPRIPQIFLMNP